MVRIIIVVISLLTVTSIQGQKRVFSCDFVESFLCQKGVIFDSAFNLPFDHKRLQTRFTPQMDDLKIAEKVLFDSYSSLQVTTNDTWLKARLQKSFRQYAGFINSCGEKIIIIQILFYNELSEARYYKNFENEFIVGFGSFYEKNTKSLSINLTEKSVSIF